ncbi:hypothetical protein ACFZC7_29540 [Streptomyces massasporeus]|uniref:hypothetical protein n=1 Tax=Streptomyces massasporeus TaxID=67324 RepID=UPI0036E64815
MGFSGHLVFARSDRPLLEAPLFGSLGQELKATVHTGESRPGGWQMLQFDVGTWDDSDLPSLVEWSGAPACVAEVSDSDLALVTGLDAIGRRWQAWLNLDIAARLLAEEPEDLEDQLLWLDTPEFHDAVRHKRAELDAEIPTDAESAVVWAAAAGTSVTPQPAQIEELLRSHETFAEDLFSRLLDELGFPRPRSADARDGG